MEQDGDNKKAKQIHEQHTGELHFWPSQVKFGAGVAANCIVCSAAAAAPPNKEPAS